MKAERMASSVIQGSSSAGAGGEAPTRAAPASPKNIVSLAAVVTRDMLQQNPVRLYGGAGGELGTGPLWPIRDSGRRWHFRRRNRWTRRAAAVKSTLANFASARLEASIKS